MSAIPDAGVADPQVFLLLIRKSLEQDARRLVLDLVDLRVVNGNDPRASLSVENQVPAANQLFDGLGDLLLSGVGHYSQDVGQDVPHAGVQVPVTVDRRH